MESRQSSQIVTLKLKEDFSNLKQNGRLFRQINWALFSYRKNSYAYSRFAWTLPAYLAKAVVRNRLKRWCRVVVREYKDLNNYDINIIFLRKKKDFYKNLTYETFSSELRKALHYITKQST